MTRTLLVSTLVLLLALGAAACSGGGSREDFAEQVVESRDRTEAALASMAQSRTWEELLDRLRVAADESRGAADDLDEVSPPSDLRDEAEQLSSALRALGDELQATADALEDSDFESPIQGLEFENWDRVQDELEALRNEGIEVAPLERH